MRWLSFVLLLFATGCAHRQPSSPHLAASPPCPSVVSAAPVAQTPPVSSELATTTTTTEELEAPARPRDPREAERVLAALFPKRLASLRECPKSSREPATWVEVDDVQLENLDAGRFVPVIERRERGRFTGSEDEVRYIIRIDNCQPNTGTLRIQAVFTEWSLTPGSPADWRRPRAVWLRESWAPLG